MVKFMFPALLLLAAAPDAALAQQVQSDIRVTYDDLDLARPEGVTALDRRIRRAIGTACTDEDGVDWLARIEARRCRTMKRTEIAQQRERVLAAAVRKGVAVASVR